MENSDLQFIYEQEKLQIIALVSLLHQLFYLIINVGFVSVRHNLITMTNSSVVCLSNFLLGKFWPGWETFYFFIFKMRVVICSPAERIPSI